MLIQIFLKIEETLIWSVLERGAPLCITGSEVWTGHLPLQAVCLFYGEKPQACYLSLTATAQGA